MTLIQVTCDLPEDKTYLGKETKFEVTNCPTLKCYDGSMDYKASKEQIEALISSSLSCRQTIKLECISAPIRDLYLNQEQLAWVDRFGVQHNLATLGNNSCDARSLDMMTDVGEIDEMTKLPLSKIMYGPLHESAQMVIHVGPLECLPQDEDQIYSLKKHVIDLESKIDENNDTIAKNDEECKEKVQELAAKDTEHDDKLQALTTKDSQHDNKLQTLTTRDSQNLNGVKKCPSGEPNTFLIEGICYMFVDQRKTFNDAKSYCQSKRGRLFEPRTLHTNKLVAYKGYEVLKYRKMWLGIISSNGESGPWKFATSGENVVRTIWASGQPDERENEICAYYNIGFAGKWRDFSCNSRSLRFICEFV
jgi:hypothetical protein